MDTFSFRFDNGQKTSTILFWFFTTLLTIPTTAIILLIHPDPFFPTWLLLISLPLMLVAIYKLFKVASERQSTETVSLSKEGFTSSCFGTALFSDIRSIQIPAQQMDLLWGRQYNKQTDVDYPSLVFSITISSGKTLNWILNEWGGLYNSEDDFSIFFNFLTALTDQLYLHYHTNEPYKHYLKILDEKGSWQPHQK